MRSQEALKELIYARKNYEKSINRKFDTLAVVTNAEGFVNKVQAAANQHGITLIGLNEISKLLEEHIVTERDILARLDKQHIAI